MKIDLKGKWMSYKNNYGGTTFKHFSCFNPYFVIRNKLKYHFWKIVRKKFKEWNIEQVLCQGCGEGIAKYRIRDPNHSYGNRKYNCCKRCCLFYDQRWSRTEIVGWKPMMKKEKVEE